MFKESSIHHRSLPSWLIAVDAREVFVDLVAVAPDGKGAHFVRTLNRKDNLVSGIAEGISLFPAEAVECISSGEARILVTSDFDRVSLRERWGSGAALVATEGFENILDIGSQQRLNTFGLHAEKKKSILSRDFIFGISERSLSSGAVEKSPSSEEIEIIASTLTLNEIKNVAICFLHSLKNPSNEKDVATKLKEKGFNVFLSSDEQGNEIERTQKAANKVFLASGRNELIEKLHSNGFALENIFVKKDRPTFSRSGPKESLYVEFLEDRIIIKNESIQKELDISPLSLVDLDEAGYVHLGRKIDSEPGPVAFGKGLQMTVFDILALNSKMSVSGIPRLKFDSTKVLRQLSPLAKNLRMDVESCGVKCLNLFSEALALEVEKYLDGVPSFMIAGGWLATYFATSLARRLGVRKLFIPHHASWLSLLELLETEITSKTATTKIGVFAGELPGTLSEGVIHDL